MSSNTTRNYPSCNVMQPKTPPIHFPSPRVAHSRPPYSASSPFIAVRHNTYRLVASNAFSSPTIRRLLPRPNFPLIKAPAGTIESSQCLNTAFMSRGTPSSTTVVTGTNGRSSADAARMPYSCANNSAVPKDADWDLESAPTILTKVWSASSLPSTVLTYI